MAENRNILIRLYAQAMLQTFNITYTDVLVFHTIGSYFIEHPTCAFFLRSSSISVDEKISIMISTIRDIFDVRDHHTDIMVRLLQLLAEHNRMTLFMRVCTTLRNIYYTKHAIEACDVFTSHDIDIKVLQPVIVWLEKQLNKTLEPAYHVDQSLIAGIRIRGQTFIWEDSIARNVRHMKHDAYAQWGIA